jgi:hypothetical protein
VDFSSESSGKAFTEAVRENPDLDAVIIAAGR